VSEDETREQIIGFYRRAWEHADATIGTLAIDAPGHVPWWPRPDVKLFNVLVHVLTETTRHAGHADILREQIDGVTGVSAGSPIAISCKGMGVLHPYLVIGTSLLLGIDPAAAPLLSGQVVSLAGLKAILAALPELDLASEALPISGLNGDVNLTWPVPTFQPLDPNAGCPPTQKEFNSGLLGCAVAMIDLLTFKPVSAGSAVFEYSGFPFLPPNPTLALSTTTADRNQTVSISDAPGATTYWWLTTLAKLQSALGGGAGSPPSVTVTMVDAVLSGSKPDINDTKTYDNGKKVVPSYLLNPVLVTKDNWKPILVDGGYYTEDQLK